VDWRVERLIGHDFDQRKRPAKKPALLTLALGDVSTSR
jgi:hypothetical protein